MSEQHQVGNVSAELVRMYGGPRNETKTWRVTSRAGSHYVTTSRIFAPAETLVFRTDVEGRGPSIEVAGGREMGHVEALKQYLETV